MTYLNPEHGRPFLRQQLKAGSEWLSPKQNQTYVRVLEAGIRFDNSMNKLENQLQNSFALPSDDVDIDAESDNGY